MKRLKPSYIANTGKYPSEKGGGSVQYESFLERNLIAQLSVDPTVKRIEEYPFEVRWIDPSGIERTYTPDLLVEFCLEQPTHIVEVKSRSEIRRDFAFLKYKYRAVTALIKSMGYRFVVRTEKALTGPRHDNLLFLRKYQNAAADPCLYENLASILRGSSCSVRDVLETMASTNEGKVRLLSAIWANVASGCIQTDLSIRLTNLSIISLPAELEVE